MADQDNHPHPMEQKLRAILPTQDTSDFEQQVERVMRRGRQQVGVRDLATFGFARMLTVLLNLLVHLHRRPTGESHR